MNTNNDLSQRVRDMVDEVSHLAENDPRSEMIAQMIDACLKMAKEGHDTGQVKLVTHAIKEMRYAYQVFNRYKGTRKVSIYGSARTPEDHRDYIAAFGIWKANGRS